MPLEQSLAKWPVERMKQTRARIFSMLRLPAVSPLVWGCWAFAYGLLILAGLQDVLDWRLPGNDDLMRLQQVRDFLAGQAWADTSQHRFITPEGGLMHFSRLPDVIMAVLVLAARPFVGVQNSELFMLIVYPAIILLSFLTVSNLVMRTVDARATVPYMIIIVMLTPLLVQFYPGRIDHHSIQLVLVMLLMLATLRAQTSQGWAIAAAVIIIFMLAVGMESAPFAAAAAIGVGVPWLLDGARKTLFCFGAALTVTAPIMLILLNAGGALFVPQCDSYSTIHLIIALATGCGAIGLVEATHWLNTKTRRFFAGAAAGGAVIAFLAFNFPQCLADPFGSFESTLIIQWRHGLTASRTALELYESSKSLFLDVFWSIIIGFAAVIYMFLRAPAERRRGWLVVLLFVCVGLFLSLWLVRSASFAAPIAAIPTASIIAAAYARSNFAQPRTILRFMVIAFLISPFAGNLFSNFLKEESDGSIFTPKGRSQIASEKTEKNCTANGLDFAALNQLEPGLVLTQTDIGPEVVAFTHHSITSAPYHRNLKGIEQSLDVFTSPPDVAWSKARSIRAEYVIFCPTGEETEHFSTLYPEGLAALLKKGETPNWLTEIRIENAPYRFFRIERQPIAGG